MERRRITLLIMIIVSLTFVISACTQQGRPAPVARQSAPVTRASVEPAGPLKPAGNLIPAYYKTAPTASSLAPTLAPEKYTGVTRDAYRAAREIPVTLAQLPCYCHCDESFGHKSLHSCFEDGHAGSCAVCVNEALAAYRLQKEQGLTAAQIREQIIAQYSSEE